MTARMRTAFYSSTFLNREPQLSVHIHSYHALRVEACENPRKRLRVTTLSLSFLYIRLVNTGAVFEF